MATDKDKMQKKQKGGGRKRRLMDLVNAEAFSPVIMVLLILIIVLSTVLLVLCAIFLGSFNLHLLRMASNNFLASPILMVIASSVSIGFAVLCVTLIFKKKEKVYMVFGGMSLVVFIIQLAAVILAFLLRNNIDNDLNKVNVDKELRLASTDNATMDVWNTLQSRYKCCGGRGNSGYREWENHLSDGFPDSCCTVKYQDCGVQARRTLETDFTQTIYERIHVRGCITSIKESLDTYVMPLLLAWGLIGIMVCVCEVFLLVCCLMFTSHLRSKAGGRTRLTSTGRLEMEPLSYTSTLNVNLK